MVQISLFDFTSPPEPISGEAFALSPLDALIFLPGGAAIKTGEKTLSSIFTQIARIFAPKTILPTTKTFTTAAFRFPGAPLRQTASVTGEKTSIFGISPTTSILKTGTTTTAAKTTSFTLSSLFKRPSTSTKLLGTAAVGTTFFGLATQTPGGQETLAGISKGFGDVTNITNQASEFFKNNPLILAGIVGLGLILVVKK